MIRVSVERGKLSFVAKQGTVFSLAQIFSALPGHGSGWLCARGRLPDLDMTGNSFRLLEQAFTRAHGAPVTGALAAPPYWA